VLSRGIAEAGRDAASCGLPCKHIPREASGKRPSATTSGREELA
jgi:hypothetical protein